MRRPLDLEPKQHTQLFEDGQPDHPLGEALEDRVGYQIGDPTHLQKEEQHIQRTNDQCQCKGQREVLAPPDSDRSDDPSR